MLNEPNLLYSTNPVRYSYQQLIQRLSRKIDFVSRNLSRFGGGDRENERNIRGSFDCLAIQQSGPVAPLPHSLDGRWNEQLRSAQRLNALHGTVRTDHNMESHRALHVLTDGFFRITRLDPVEQFRFLHGRLSP